MSRVYTERQVIPLHPRQQTASRDGVSMSEIVRHGFKLVAEQQP